MTFPPSEPPAEDYPDDDRPPGPPPGYPQGPPPGYPQGPQPPGYPPGPPPGYPQGYPGYAQSRPGYAYGPPPQSKSRISIGLTFAGILIYILLNSVLGFAAFMVAGSTGRGGEDTVLGGAAFLLLLIAFGGGAALMMTKNPSTRGLGLGLMIGWALTSLVTVGFCTGINPQLYTT